MVEQSLLLMVFLSKVWLKKGQRILATRHKMIVVVQDQKKFISWPLLHELCHCDSFGLQLHV